MERKVRSSGFGTLVPVEEGLNTKLDHSLMPTVERKQQNIGSPGGKTISLPSKINYNTEGFAEIQNEDTEPENSVNCRKKRRTVKDAGKTATMPDKLAIITHPDYRDALRFNEEQKKSNENAFLIQVMEDAEIAYDDRTGLATIFGKSAGEIEFWDWRLKAQIGDIDTITLSSIYTILYRNLKEELMGADETWLKENILRERFAIDAFIPDFMEYLGYGRNYSKKNLKDVINKIRRYHNTFGVIKEKSNGRLYTNAYMLLNLAKIDEKRNTITLSSPYMNMVIKKLFDKEIKTDPFTGKIIFGRNKKPLSVPVYSFQDTRIKNLKNKYAVEILLVIVDLIEEAGSKGTPSIKLSTIIKRCPRMHEALLSTDKGFRQNQILKRSFEAAWEYIPKYTDLMQRYKYLKMPEITPTIKDLDMIITFKHEGKI